MMEHRMRKASGVGFFIMLHYVPIRCFVINTYVTPQLLVLDKYIRVDLFKLHISYSGPYENMVRCKMQGKT